MKQPIGLKQGYRTPFVKKDGPFAHLNAVELSCLLVDELLKRIDFPRDTIQHVVWGMVVPDPNILICTKRFLLKESKNLS